MDNLRTEQLPGEPAYANGWAVYLADEEKTAEIVDELFLNPVQDDNIDTSGIDTSGIDKTKIEIELLNGTNSDTKLKRIQKRLEKAGYTVSKTNETSQTETTTMNC